MTEQEAKRQLEQLGERVPVILIQFGTALADARTGPYIDGWRYFMEKPAKWANEWAAWMVRGRPLEGDRLFEDFCEAVEELERV